MSQRTLKRLQNPVQISFLHSDELIIANLVIVLNTENFKKFPNFYVVFIPNFNLHISDDIARGTAVWYLSEVLDSCRKPKPERTDDVAIHKSMVVRRP